MWVRATPPSTNHASVTWIPAAPPHPCVHALGADWLVLAGEGDFCLGLSFVVLCSRREMMEDAAHIAAGRRGGAMTGMGSSGGGPVGEVSEW